MTVGDIIALASMLGSIFIFFLTRNEQLKAKEYNETAKKYYDLKIKQIQNAAIKKADCDASIVKIGSDKWILKIFNKGDTNATNVYFKFLTNNAVPNFRFDAVFPIKFLEPQKKYEYQLITNLGTGNGDWDYEVTWENEDGTTGNKKGILNLPLM